MPKRFNIGDRRKEPTDEDVRRVAELYRQYYGSYASQVVGDHMLGASFGPDGRHHLFLKRVSAELFNQLATKADRELAIDHRVISGQ